MARKPLNCLIVGDTPATQFLAWRLSLTNAFIILVSQHISRDGLISWKSAQLGSNFYRPNEFTKNYDELEAKLVDAEGKQKFKLDIIILSCLSFAALNKYSSLLARYSCEDTIVLVNANFGVELERLVIDKFQGSSLCVLSVLCDVEGRQLSSGSYALVSDRFEFYFGISYTPVQGDVTSTLEKMLKINAAVVQDLFQDQNSTLNAMLQQLHGTKVEKVVKFSPDKGNDMALKIWKYVIPRISLHILSIVFEQFDYEELALSNSSSAIFRDLVSELMMICLTQNNSVVKNFMLPAYTEDHANSETVTNLSSLIDYMQVVEETKRRKKLLDQSTINEYPEFLSLSFEAYCFYHRLEFPAHILLYQPVLLAESYGKKCSSLNFLFGFYSRLLSISGFSIEGGPTTPNVPSLLFGIRSQITNHSEQTLVSKEEFLSEKVNRHWSKMKHTTRNHEERPKEADFCATDCMTSTMERKTAPISSNVSVDSCQACGSSLSPPFLDGAEPEIRDGFRHRIVEEIDDWEGNDCTSIIDDVIRLPNFEPKISSSKALTAYRPQTTALSGSLEAEIRRNPSFAARTLDDRWRQRYADQHQKAALPREENLWRFQRRFFSDRQLAKRPSSHPINPLRTHIGLLQRSNMKGILTVTTSRYGHVDSTRRILHQWSPTKSKSDDGHQQRDTIYRQANPLDAEGDGIYMPPGNYEQ
ncbi:LAMI_0G08482g1_1 [Lachancea mirantina]|uniref:LAMI_0G08482g1_1 n=1 Tax=Lachancea mirantina TaxID=1230905 RepID=A0A1G4K9W9_9SACH|nr:LAMI_0G08482g1_1 [Lachancea mirantina]